MCVLTNHSPPVDQHDPDGSVEVLAAPLCPQLASVPATRMRVMFKVAAVQLVAAPHELHPVLRQVGPQLGLAPPPLLAVAQEGLVDPPPLRVPSPQAHTPGSRCCQGAVKGQGVKVSLVTVAAGWRRSGRPPRPCPPPRPRSRPRRGGRTPWRGSRPPRTPPST